MEHTRTLNHCALSVGLLLSGSFWWWFFWQLSSLLGWLWLLLCLVLVIRQRYRERHDHSYTMPQPRPVASPQPQQVYIEQRVTTIYVQGHSSPTYPAQRVGDL